MSSVEEVCIDDGFIWSTDNDSSVVEYDNSVDDSSNDESNNDYSSSDDSSCDYSI